MNKLIVLALVGIVMLGSGFACADTPDGIRNIGQTLIGNNEECPALAKYYVAKTFDEALGSADVRVKASFQHSVANFKDSNEIVLECGLEY